MLLGRLWLASRRDRNHERTFTMAFQVEELSLEWIDARHPLMSRLTGAKPIHGPAPKARSPKRAKPVHGPGRSPHPPRRAPKARRPRSPSRSRPPSRLSPTNMARHRHVSFCKSGCAAAATMNEKSPEVSFGAFGCAGPQLDFPAQQFQGVTEAWVPFEQAIVIGWR
jgi:hypothetical protein